MTKPNKHLAAIRKVALSLPEVEEGTSSNKISFKAGKKGFLYIGEDQNGGFDAKLKLTDSLEEAHELAGKQPMIYSVGSTGWVDADFPGGQAPPAGLMKRWIEESYCALVPDTLVAQFKAEPTKKKATKKSGKKVSARKKTTKKRTSKKAAAKKTTRRRTKD